MPEINPPIYLRDGCYSAERDRQLIQAMVCGEGVQDLLTGDLRVTDGATGMQVVVAAGDAFILGDNISSQGMYYVRSSSAVTLTLVASDTSDRIDTVIAEVLDSEYSGTSNLWRLRVVKGDPGPSPSAPTLPPNAIPLADIAVAASVTSITTSNITDVRQQAEFCPSMLSGTTPSLSDMIVHDTSGSFTFTKASHPGAKTVKVICVGGGGGGSGCEGVPVGELAVGAGGGSGGYSESLLDVDSLPASVAITVGSGGAGGVFNGNLNGQNGTASSFGSFVVANGGSGATGRVNSGTNPDISGSAPGATIGTGNYTAPGSPGGPAMRVSGSQGISGYGGASQLGAQSRPFVDVPSPGTAGSPGQRGSGGSGGYSRRVSGEDPVPAHSGGAGGDGVVIIEVYN